MSSDDPYLDIREVGIGRRKRQEFHCSICPEKSFTRRRDYDGHLKSDDHTMNASLERLFIRRRTNTPPPISPTQQLAAAAGPDLRLDDLGEGRGDLDHDVVAPVPSLQIVPNSSEAQMALVFSAESPTLSSREPSPGGFDAGMHFQDHEFPLTQADLEMGAAESATLAIRPPRKGFSAIAPRDSSFFPWFSEHAFTSFVVTHPPGAPLSQALSDRILAWGGTLKAGEIPSIKTINNFEKNLVQEVGLFKPKERILSSGYPITYIDPVDLVTSHFANPSKRKLMQTLPVLNESLPSDSFYHFKKMEDSLQDPAIGPLMVEAGGKSYFVGELASLQRGNESVVIAITGGLHSDGHKGHGVGIEARMKDGKVTLNWDEPQFVFDVEDLRLDAREVRREFGVERIVILENGIETEGILEHEYRALARGLPVYQVFLILTLDDFSGNFTTRWNCHYLLTARDASLPSSENQKRENCLVVTASKRATPHDLIETFVSACNDTHSQPRLVYDCLAHKEAWLQCFVAFGGHDGPMAGEVCAHTPSGNALAACRRCRYGGNLAKKITTDSILELVHGGELRTNESIKAELDARATSEIESGKSTENIKRYKETGVRDRNQERRLVEVRRLGDELYATSPWGPKPNKSTELWKQYEKCKNRSEQSNLEKHWRNDKTEWGFEGQLAQIEQDLRETMGDDTAYLRTPGFSLAQDTSEDILHIGPLGILKYKWIDTLNIVGRAHVLPILARLSTRGISIRKTEVGLYIYRAGGLVGKDYKLLAQLAPFFIAILHHHGLIDDELARVWYSIGRMFPLLYVQEVDSRSQYRSQLRSEINSFFIVCFEQDPLDVLAKIKYHKLGHVDEDAERLGLPSNIDNETTESMNGLARQRIQKSNKRDPESKLVAGFGGAAALSFVTSGGFWRQSDGKITSAGPGVKAMAESGMVDKLMGTDKKERPPLTSTFRSTDLAITDYENAPDVIKYLLSKYDEERQIKLNAETPSIRQMKTVRSGNGDVLRDEDFIVFTGGEEVEGQTIIGKINEMWKWTSGGTVSMVVVVRAWKFTEEPFIGGILGHAEPEPASADLLVLHLNESSQVAHLSTNHDCIRFNCTLPKASNPDPEHSHPDDGILVNLGTFHAFGLLEPLRPPCEETTFGQKEAERAASNLKAIVEKTDAHGNVKIVRPTKKQLAKLKTTKRKGKGKVNEKSKETVEKVEKVEVKVEVKVEAEVDAEEEADEGEFEVVSDEEKDSREERNRRYTDPKFEDDNDSEDSNPEEEELDSDSKPSKRKNKTKDEITVLLRAMQSKSAARNQQPETNSDDEEIIDEEREEVAQSGRPVRARKQSIRLQESVASMKLAEDQKRDAKKRRK